MSNPSKTSEIQKCKPYHLLSVNKSHKFVFLYSISRWEHPEIVYSNTIFDCLSSGGQQQAGCVQSRLVVGPPGVGIRQGKHFVNMLCVGHFKRTFKGAVHQFYPLGSGYLEGYYSGRGNSCPVSSVAPTGALWNYDKITLMTWLPLS